MSTTYAQAAGAHPSQPSQPSQEHHPKPAYIRPNDQKARTSHQDEQSYILTLRTDRAHHKRMTALRDKYFPRALNHLEAHIALFRALPGSELPRITSDIAALATQTASFPVHTGAVTPLGRGFAPKQAQPGKRMQYGFKIDLRAQQVDEIYKGLKGRWWEFLSDQDRHFQGHYTIMNKVEDPGVAEKAFQEVKENFEGSAGMAEGLSLYRYDRGFWRHERDFVFEQGREDGEHSGTAGYGA